MVIEMEVTRIYLKTHPLATIYIGYFEGPRMTVALRQELIYKISGCELNSKRATASVYQTMINFGYKPIDKIVPIDHTEEFLIRGIDMVRFNDVAYQIFNKDTKLYSRGGNRPMFGKKGKVWRTKSAFHSHLRFVSKPEETYKNCMVAFACKSDDSLNYINMDIYLKTFMEEEEKKHVGSENKKVMKIRNKYVGKKIIDVKEGVVHFGHDSYILVLDDGTEIMKQ
jgi:hypothetical protein